MKKLKENNSGFSLIELIIAIAILAFLMTAVASLMSSSMISYRKTKAEITVHNNAQDTYNVLSDAIMMANKVKVVGYTTGSKVDFDTVGGDTTETSVEIEILPKSEIEEATKLMSEDEKITYLSTHMSFDDVSTVDALGNEIHTDIYLKQIDIWLSTPFDPTCANATSLGDTYDVTYKENGVNITKNIPNDQVDTCHVTYYFDNANMYVTREYKYMQLLDDVVDVTDVNERDRCLFTNKLRYVNGPSNSYTAAVAKFSSNKNAMSVELQFSDKNMNYNSKGMINIRNSNVIKSKN